MVQTPEPCALGPCSEQAVVTLRLLVDGSSSVLPTCERHAEWLRAYVEEDADVRLLDQASPTLPLDDSRQGVN
jgi:hypothetical protein